MIDIVAKMGETIPADCYGILTGNVINVGGREAYEVSLPTIAGQRPHFVTNGSAITDASVVSEGSGAFTTFVDVKVVALTGAVAASGLLSARTDGTCAALTSFGAVCGQALVASSGDAVLAAVFVSPYRKAAAATIATNGYTGTSGTDAIIPEMTATIELRNKTGVILQSEMTIEYRASDDFEIALYCTPLGGSPTEITAHRRSRKLAPLGVTFQIGEAFSRLLSIAEIPSPTADSHTFALYYKANAGAARFVGLERSLKVVEA